MYFIYLFLLESDHFEADEALFVGLLRVELGGSILDLNFSLELRGGRSQSLEVSLQFVLVGQSLNDVLYVSEPLLLLCIHAQS